MEGLLRMKRIVSLLLFLLLVSGCEKEYELVASSEYNFYKEEYDSKYNSYIVDFKLESDLNKVVINGKCDSGTITISLDDIDEFREVIGINEFYREIEFKDNVKDVVSFKIEINEESEGSIKLNLYSKQ